MTDKPETISVATLLSIKYTLEWAEKTILEFIEQGGTDIKVQVSCDSKEARVMCPTETREQDL